ncbi:hypothetical protein QBC46DRAFT_271671, partial [Diplogelasinospora grovesii]
IIYQDIKLKNILIKHRDPEYNPYYLNIKLSDFSLFKTSSLKTFYGSKTYCLLKVQNDNILYIKAINV